MRHFLSRPPSRRLSPQLPLAAAAALFGAVLAAAPARAEAMPQEGPLKVGDRAPGFPSPLPSTAGERPGAKTIDLEEFLGRRNIVLAFYVADWTGG